jgi:hypothetical protein
MATEQKRGRSEPSSSRCRLSVGLANSCCEREEALILGFSGGDSGFRRDESIPNGIQGASFHHGPTGDPGAGYPASPSHAPRFERDKRVVTRLCAFVEPGSVPGRLPLQRSYAELGTLSADCRLGCRLGCECDPGARPPQLDLNLAEAIGHRLLNEAESERAETHSCAGRGWAEQKA